MPHHTAIGSYFTYGFIGIAGCVGVLVNNLHVMFASIAVVLLTGIYVMVGIIQRDNKRNLRLRQMSERRRLHVDSCGKR